MRGLVQESENVSRPIETVEQVKFMPMDRVAAVARVAFELVYNDGRSRRASRCGFYVDRVLVRDIYDYASRWRLDAASIAGTHPDLVAASGADADRGGSVVYAGYAVSVRSGR